MNYDSEIGVFESLGPLQTTFLAIYFLALVLALGVVLYNRRLLRSMSLFSIIVGIALYFHAGALQHIGMVNAHIHEMTTGGSDPIFIHRDYAKYFTKLSVFRLGSTFAVLLGGIGFLAATMSTITNKQGSEPSVDKSKVSM